MTATIIFDFDGTLALGNGPVLAYARSVAEALERSDFVENARRAVAEYEAGTSSALDGYDAVARAAVDDGADPAHLQAAYTRSRDVLGTDAAPVAPPSDLLGTLERLARSARLVLATNAPSSGIGRVLDDWGVTECFAATYFAVGKPAGLVPLLRDALADGPTLSVGDIYAFDLAEAHRLGAATALVGVTAATSPEGVTMRGATVADIAVDIEKWATEASRAAASHAR